MKHYLVTVPDDGRHYEIYTPIEDGIREVVTCDKCRKARKSYINGERGTVFCMMFSATVEPWRFCSWGEPEQPFAE